MKDIKITLTQEQIEDIQKQLKPSLKERLVSTIFKQMNFDLYETQKYFDNNEEKNNILKGMGIWLDGYDPMLFNPETNDYESIKEQLPKIDSNDLLIDYIIKTIESKLYLRTPQGTIPFILTDNQKEIVKGIVKHKHNIVKQSRQTGVTSIVCAVIAVMVNVGKWENVKLTACNKQTSYMNISRVKEFLIQLGCPCDEFIINNKETISFKNSVTSKISCISNKNQGYSLDSLDFYFVDILTNETYPHLNLNQSKCILFTMNHNMSSIAEIMFKNQNNSLNKITSHWTKDFRFNKDLMECGTHWEGGSCGGVIKYYYNDWYLKMIENFNYDLKKIECEIDICDHNEKNWNSYFLPINLDYLLFVKINDFPKKPTCYLFND